MFFAIDQIKTKAFLTIDDIASLIYGEILKLITNFDLKNRLELFSSEIYKSITDFTK